MKKEQDKINVYFIHPWGIGSTLEYLNGLCCELQKYANLTLFTAYGYEKPQNAHYAINRVYFKFSDGMKDGTFRKVIRGLEYAEGYSKVLKTLKRNKVDVVHIRWLLEEKVDYHYIKEIKKYCKKLVYTADNVIPHIGGTDHIESLSKIYDLFDVIIVHGDEIAQEFNKYFPEHSAKLCVLHHGVDYQLMDTKTDINKVDSKYLLNGSFDKEVLIIGQQYYNKGTDRIVKAWINDSRFATYRLSVVGKSKSGYKEYEDLKPLAEGMPNIRLIDERVDNYVLNYYLQKCDLVMLPYRHASMSGVIFTAAALSKPIAVADAGAFREYIEGVGGSFIFQNDDNAFTESLLSILGRYSKEEFAEMGAEFHKNIIEKYSWNKIAEDTYTKCYIT